MSLFNKLLILLCLLFAFGSKAQKQNCQISFKGVVIDESTGEVLPFATVFLEAGGMGTQADEKGQFAFSSLCPMETHLKVTHLGCEPLRLFIKVLKDTSLVLALHHHEELLNETIIHGSKTANTLEKSSVIDRDVILEKGDASLAKISSSVPGVSILKTGGNIAKPIIQGMYGNRIGIINNGIEQAGQQWGNDHAPEIDPTNADHIAVVKGANALAYSGRSLGGLIITETDDISFDPHLHGEARYLFTSQGLGQQLNIKLEKGTENVAFRVGGSASKAGDLHSPSYYLSNTSKELYSLYGLIQKELNQTWKATINTSLFETKTGILKGAQVGSLSDLESAFNRDVPFFTSSERGFNIEAPSQKVRHVLGVFKLEGNLKKNQLLSFNYGFQRNTRDEFDVRRSGRSELPALSLIQNRHQNSFNYSKLLSDLSLLKLGINYAFVQNKNEPETGILPLIPDYLSHQTATYAIFQKDINKLSLELGARLSYLYFNAAYISREINREIINYSPTYLNKNFSLGAKYNVDLNSTIGINIGYSERNPEVNELYSNGLHQGVGSIEEGDPNLKSEESFKGIASYQLKLNNKLFIQAEGYLHFINDYIFLRPTDEPRLTIRGAFPVFTYNQTKALLSGFDFLASYSPYNYLKVILKYSTLKGTDITADKTPLIYIPPTNLNSTLEFSISDFKAFKNNTINISYDFTAEQKNYSIIADFLPPPLSYGLWDVSINSSLIRTDNKTLKLTILAENVFNKTYRNYLNRQRYFADEIGREISISLRYQF